MVASSGQILFPERQSEPAPANVLRNGDAAVATTDEHAERMRGVVGHHVLVVDVLPDHGAPARRWVALPMRRTESQKVLVDPAGTTK